jgi:tetratricopeptide (TPR) repeat protein
MAKKNKTEDQFIQVEQALSKTEQYLVNNQKSLMIILGAIIGLILLFKAYQKFYIEPLEEDAQIEVYMAELYFQKDSFNLALNGDGQYAGFLDVAEEYSSTKVGNLANYYAGLCYLNTGDYNNAITYLENFSSDDIILSSLALGCIGDAYMELGDTDKAKSSYKDAVENSNNEFTTPRYMMKLAMIHESKKEYSEALEIYKSIKVDFKTSLEASGIEKYISRAENR